MTSTRIPDFWRWKISALFEPLLHNANACNFYRDPFLSNNFFFVYRCTAIHVTATWSPALARTTSWRKSVLLFMWLLPGLLPQHEILICLKVFCHSCDFYLDSCLSKNSFFAWKCSAIPVTSACIPAKRKNPLFAQKCTAIDVTSNYILARCTAIHVIFTWAPATASTLYSYLKVFCHSCDFYLVACLCKNSFFVEKCGVIHVSSTWMRSSLVVRASDLQCTSCNGGSWVRSQHPSAQWNLMGGRWSSAEYSTKQKNYLDPWLIDRMDSRSVSSSQSSSTQSLHAGCPTYKKFKILKHWTSNFSPLRYVSFPVPSTTDKTSTFNIIK